MENHVRQDISGDRIHHVLDVTDATDHTYILKVERHGLPFTPGQHILLGEGDSVQMREYSVFSGKDDEWFEVLIREIPQGYVSPKLRRLKKGDVVQIEGPVGFFTINPVAAKHYRFLFISSGTGISPFHSFVRSFPGMRYYLIHGSRHGNEFYGRSTFNFDHVTHCTSGDNSGHFHGRLTGFLSSFEVPHDMLCYLCGNSQMIIDGVDILKGKGVPDAMIHTEVYF